MPTYVEKKLDPQKRKRARKHEVFQVTDVPRVRWSVGTKFGGTVRPLGEFGRRERIGVHLEEIPPGRWNGTFHWHTHEEEHFYVLSGYGTMRVGRKIWKVGPGSYAVFRRHGKVGDAIQNTGKEVLAYLIIGTRETGDTCVYPDSGKIYVRSLGRVGRLKKAEYWDGEA